MVRNDRNRLSYGRVQLQLLELRPMPGMGSQPRAEIHRVRLHRRRQLDSRARVSAARRAVAGSARNAPQNGAAGHGVLADRRRVPRLAARRRDAGRRVYPAHHALGQARRLPAHRHHRRPLRSPGTLRARGARNDARYLPPRRPRGRAVRDHHQHRAARPLHHQAGVHGRDAGLRRFARICG